MSFALDKDVQSAHLIRIHRSRGDNELEISPSCQDYQSVQVLNIDPALRWITSTYSSSADPSIHQY